MKKVVLWETAGYLRILTGCQSIPHWLSKDPHCCMNIAMQSLTRKLFHFSSIHVYTFTYHKRGNFQGRNISQVKFSRERSPTNIKLSQRDEMAANDEAIVRYQKALLCMWIPRLQDDMLEPGNSHDRSTVAVEKEGSHQTFAMTCCGCAFFFLKGVETFTAL